MVPVTLAKSAAPEILEWAEWAGWMLVVDWMVVVGYMMEVDVVWKVAVARSAEACCHY